jgi:beta-glucosidase-like glycosyl hydrolase
LNLDHPDFHLLVDDVSFHHFRLVIVDKYQFPHNVTLAEVTTVQVVKKVGTLMAFE